MKKIAILGSTGSIGLQTLEVIDNHEDLKVVALSANRSVDEVARQCVRYEPSIVAMMDVKAAHELSVRLREYNLEHIQVLSGMDGLIQVAAFKEADVTVTAVVGMIGLLPTMEAIKAGKTIALANKETLVCAGELIMSLAREYGVSILPVDSEHSAIYQSLSGYSLDRIEKVVLTASGGPFRGKTLDDLSKVTLEQALKHPNWDMGAKITIDSSTLMNKGLEVIEAKWLFNLRADQIDVVVHPQSILHSMVMYVDGSCIGQMGLPDMKLPIQYALFEGERKQMPYERLDLTAIGSLTFMEPDRETFECLGLAYRAMELGGVFPTVMNAANEKCVELFLKRSIGYLDIPRLIRQAMDAYAGTESLISESETPEPLTLERILEAEKWAHAFVTQKVEGDI